MKKTIMALLVLALLPLLGQAAEPAKNAAGSTASTQKTYPAMEITLSGVTQQNRAQIEKLAKQVGAKQASLNIKTGILKISHTEKFDKDGFSKLLTEQVPGVS